MQTTHPESGINPASYILRRSEFYTVLGASGDVLEALGNSALAGAGAARIEMGHHMDGAPEMAVALRQTQANLLDEVIEIECIDGQGGPWRLWVMPRYEIMTARRLPSQPAPPPRPQPGGPPAIG